jgi:hypothetical protein
VVISAVHASYVWNCTVSGRIVSLMPHSFIAVSLVCVSTAALWLLAPPVLVTIAVRKWKPTSREHSAGLAGVWPLVGAAVLVNWLLLANCVP